MTDKTDKKCLLCDQAVSPASEEEYAKLAADVVASLAAAEIATIKLREALKGSYSDGRYSSAWTVHTAVSLALKLAEQETEKHPVVEKPKPRTRKPVVVDPNKSAAGNDVVKPRTRKKT